MFNIHHLNTFLFLSKAGRKEFVPDAASGLRFSKGGFDSVDWNEDVQQTTGEVPARMVYTQLTHPRGWWREQK